MYKPKNINSWNILYIGTYKIPLTVYPTLLDITVKDSVLLISPHEPQQTTWRGVDHFDTSFMQKHCTTITTCL